MLREDTTTVVLYAWRENVLRKCISAVMEACSGLMRTKSIISLSGGEIVWLKLVPHIL